MWRSGDYVPVIQAANLLIFGKKVNPSSKTVSSKNSVSALIIGFLPFHVTAEPS